MPNSIKYSSEFIQSYVQTEIMSPENKFQALQTNLGLSLFFSIGTDGKFYVTKETHGATKTGWEKISLSQQIMDDFDNPSSITCKLFDTAQDIKSGKIGLAMVLNDTVDDYLYLCMGNSNKNMAWLDNPNWVRYDFDAANPPSTIEFSNLFISETKSGQFIVADIVEDPTSASKTVARYNIITTASAAPFWQVNGLSMDINTDNYETCIGRRSSQDDIDGLYTIGHINSSPQFNYQPLYNKWNPSIAANPTNLELPGNIQPESIASARNSNATTDLFCTSGNGLYYFPADGPTVGILLFNNDLFQGTRKLYAYKTSSIVTVWGLDQADQVFYTSCAIDEIETADAWSLPIPILTGVDNISPYINRVDDGNVFFGVAGGTLIKMKKSSTTNIWKKQNITLPPPDTTTPATSFSSYTTQIQLTDEQNQPVPNTDLYISASSTGHFYINNLYYVLSPIAIPIPTDNMGHITIIEASDDINGSQLMVTQNEGDTNPFIISPMDGPVDQVGELDTSDSLNDAVITNPDGSTQPLLDPNASPTDVDDTAQSNANLSTAYTDVNTAQKKSKKFLIAQSIRNRRRIDAKQEDDGIITDVGNLFGWLETGVEHVSEVVKDVATEEWHFVTTIGGVVYRGVLDTVEAVAGAIKWVFDAVVLAIEDLVKFLEFLFAWGDITNTKEVLKNFIEVAIQQHITELPTYKAAINEKIDALINEVGGWGNIDGSGDNLGAEGQQTTATNSNPNDDQNASSSYLAYHFVNNADQTTFVDGDPDSPTGIDGLLQILIDTIEEESEVMETAIGELYDLVKDVGNKTVVELLEGIISIIVDAVLQSAENIIDSAIDLITVLVDAAFAIIDKKIHIPVVTEILSFYGVPHFSFLDIITYVGAIPATMSYKLLKRTAPFPDGPTTDFLINTKDYNTLVSAINPSISQNAKMVDDNAPMYEQAADSEGAGQATIFYMGHGFTGAIQIVSAAMSNLEGEAPAKLNLFERPAQITNVANVVLSGFTDIVAPIKYPLQGTLYNSLNYICVGLNGLASLCTLHPKAGENNRKIIASVKSALTAPLLLNSAIHLTQLSNGSALNKTIAISDETSNIIYNLSQSAYTFGILLPMGPDRALCLGVMSFAKILSGGIQAVEADLGLADAIVS